MKNINELADELISGSANIKEYISFLEDGMEYFQENFDGELDSEKLSTLIDKATKNKDLQFIISGLLYCSKKETITDEIFNKLLKFFKGMRRTFMVALAHCDISFYQLMAINRMQICVEAFGWLINHMYTVDVFSVEDMKQLLKESEYIKSAWKDIFKQLLSLNITHNQEKQELISNFIK